MSCQVVCLDFGKLLDLIFGFLVLGKDIQIHRIVQAWPLSYGSYYLPCGAENVWCKFLGRRIISSEQ